MTTPRFIVPYSQRTDAEVRETWDRFQSAATHSTPGSFDDGLDYDVIEEADDAQRVEGGMGVRP